MMRVVNFQVEESHACENASLEVFNGDSAISSTIGSKMCGKSYIKQVHSSGRSIFVRYHSNSKNNSDEFKIIYRESGKINVACLTTPLI
jgi:hypothetical protein